MIIRQRFRTRNIVNQTGSDMIIELPLDDDTVNANLQVYVYEGVVEVKGEGTLLGADSEFILIPEKTSMNFVSISGNNSPSGAKTIKISQGAHVGLTAYD